MTKTNSPHNGAVHILFSVHSIPKNLNEDTSGITGSQYNRVVHSVSAIAVEAGIVGSGEFRNNL